MKLTKQILRKIIKEEHAKLLNETEYANIVFLQNSQDFDDFEGSGGRGITGFFDSDDDEKAKFLSQWDNGEYYDTSAQKPWGTNDTVKYDVEVPNTGTYILTYNSGLGYAGLVKEL